MTSRIIHSAGKDAKNTAFNYDEMDWDAYRQHRPPYPPGLYNMVYKYHEEHDGKTESALDVGAGIGIVTKELLEKFDHVTLSDPIELYVSQAREAFKSVGTARISFLQEKIENLSSSDLSTGPVDLVTAGECLHWAELETAMQRLQEMLKSGGTLAVWLYGIRPRFPQTHPKCQQALDECFDQLWALYDEKIGMDTARRAVSAANARLDSANFDPRVWRDVRRFQTCLGHSMITADYPPAESRVREGVERWEDLENDDFLSMHVDYKWLEGNLVNIAPVIKANEGCVEQFKRLEESMKGEKVTLQWPLALVLASKR